MGPLAYRNYCICYTPLLIKRLNCNSNFSIFTNWFLHFKITQFWSFHPHNGETKYKNENFNFLYCNFMSFGNYMSLHHRLVCNIISATSAHMHNHFIFKYKDFTEGSKLSYFNETSQQWFTFHQACDSMNSFIQHCYGGHNFLYHWYKAIVITQIPSDETFEYKYKGE
jgi:hypothetical protein